MKKLLLTLIVPLVLGTVFIGCEPIEEGELPEDPAATEQEM